MEFQIIISRHKKNIIAQDGDKKVLKTFSFSESGFYAAKNKVREVLEQIIVYPNFYCMETGYTMHMKGKRIDWQKWQVGKCRNNRNGKRQGWQGLLSNYFDGNINRPLNKVPQYYICVDMFWRD